MELLIGGISALAALIGSVWGIVKYYDSKKTKEQEKNARLSQEKALAQEKTLNEIHSIMNQIVKDNIKQQDDIHILKDQTSEIQIKLRDVQNTTQNMQKEIEENEVDRLRAEIIDTYNKLLNGYTLSSVEFEHVHHSYDKYTAKGGNSYVEDCMDSIREFEKDFREAGIVGFTDED